MNKKHIKDPHWIYPGDVIYLDPTTGQLMFGKPAATGNSTLSPRIRYGRSDYDEIPSIPAKVIEPFLSQPLVIDEWLLDVSPVLLGAREGRVMLGVGDIGFAKGVDADNGKRWQFYRPGKQFIDPETEEVLGVESVYLGDATITEFGEISTLAITKAVQEISQGDRLIMHDGEMRANYLPRAPEQDIRAQVISIYGGVERGGQYSIVTLNKGFENGVAQGHVLALHRKGEIIKYQGEEMKLPDEQYGMMFVFRVFDKVSYALVMQTRLPVQLLDRVSRP